MYKTSSPELEIFRIHLPGLPRLSNTLNGAFQMGHIRMIVSTGDIPGSEGWEHVSVSTPTRCPTWEEMCIVKDLFWPEEEAVYQLHPPKSQYVNNHPYCLHMWRNANFPVALPPMTMVGIKRDGVYKNAAEAEAGRMRAIARGEIEG